jgi:hypothetical protein
MADIGRDMQIIEGFLDGDSKAFRYVENLVDVAFMNWKDRLPAEEDDVKSDVIFKLLKYCSAPNFRLESGLAKLVGTIALRTCLTISRGKKKRPQVDWEECELATSEISPEGRAVVSDLLLRLWGFLPKECKRLWEWRFEGYKYEEIVRLAEAETGKLRSIESFRWRNNKCLELAREVMKKLNLM